MSIITIVEELETLYGQPGEPSLVKEVDRITPEYRAMIDTSPFAALGRRDLGGCCLLPVRPRHRPLEPLES